MALGPRSCVPTPPEVLCVAEPLLNLLEAFPEPQMQVTLFSKSSGRGSSDGGGRGCREGKVAFPVTFLESIQNIVNSKAYGTLKSSACFENSGFTDAAKNNCGGTSGAGHVLSPLAQSIHEHLLKLENAQHARGVYRIYRMESVSERAEPWERNEAERHMSLRPRSSPMLLPPSSGRARSVKSEEKGITSTIATPCPTSVCKAEAVESALGCVNGTTEACGLLTLSDIVSKGLKDKHSLSVLTGVLSSEPQPFKGLQRDQLASFVSELSQPSLASQAHMAPAVAVAGVPFEVMERVAACCSCLTHPSFDLLLLGENTVDNLITVLAAILRCISRQYAGNLVSSADTAAELQCLRSLLSCLAALVSSRQLYVCSQGDLVRLEDLCFECMFSVSRDCHEREAANYAAHVLSHVLQLYRCVWNRLEEQREAAMERFFTRLWLTDSVLLRLHKIVTGVRVMPLTMAVLTAAQSVVIGMEKITRRHAVRLEQQHQAWSTLFLRKFLPGVGIGNKGERNMCNSAVLQFCEDLAQMLSLPEYPGADMLLRSLLASLAHFSATGATVDTNHALQPLFVDVVFRVYHVVFGASHQHQLQAALPPVSSMISTAQLNHWRQLLRGGAGVGNNGGSEDECDVVSATIETGGGNRESDGCLLRALIYTALSQTQCDMTPDASAMLYHTRAAHVLKWALQGEHITESAINLLVRSAQVNDGGITLSDLNVLRPCCARLCASSEASVLSSAAKERLAVWLLAVFEVRGDQSADTRSQDLARKKALSHISELTQLHTPLFEKIWPIAARCARSESARVREGTVSLLLTLLTGTCQCATRLQDPFVVNVVTDVVSILLHFLNDPSVRVVTRSIAALDTLLTDSPYAQMFELVPGGEQLLAFTQWKLLGLLSSRHNGINRGHGTHHQAQLERLFLRRWAAQKPSDVAPFHTYASVARELLRFISAKIKYPYEVSESLPIITLLRGMRSGVLKGKKQRRTRKMNSVAEVDDLDGVMIGAAKVLWAEHERLTPQPLAAAALAVIYMMSIAHSKWVEPLLELVAQSLVQKQQMSLSLAVKTSSVTEDAASETVGVTVLHLSRILRAVLLSPSPPPIALDHLINPLTSLLSRYVGPHQQQILLSVTGVLTATITYGVDSSANQVNTKYLIVCYTLMNTYYTHVLSLMPSLRTDSRSVAYTLRFLFLLSEFLRLYPGWKRHHPELIDPSALGSGALVNKLACGDGICANVYAVAESVVHECPEESRGRAVMIVLRVMGSLCILQPTLFLRRSESLLRHALDLSSDSLLQRQGLTFIRDFLRDEDARVDRAASSGGHPSLVSSDVQLELALGASHKRCRAGLRLVQASVVEEQNSGMAMWLLQQMHTPVLQLCTSNVVAVRELVVEVLQLCWEGGLLPPSRYVSGLVALCADPQSATIRKDAMDCLVAHCERYGDMVAANAASGIVKGFDLCASCGVDELKGAPSDSHERYKMCEESELCVYARLFSSLSKPHCETIISYLLLYFHQDSRALPWMREHILNAASDDGVSHGNNWLEITQCPFPFLCHLATILAFTSFSMENDARHLLNACRSIVDLIGQCCVDFVERYMFSAQARRKASSRSSRQARGCVSVANPEDDAIFLWKCFGVLCVTRLCAFLRTVYGLHSAKCRITSAKRDHGSHQSPLHNHHAVQTVASAAFQRDVEMFARSFAPLWGTSKVEKVKIVKGRALSNRSEITKELHTVLTRYLQEECAQAAPASSTLSRSRIATAKTRDHKLLRPRCRRSKESESDEQTSGGDSSFPSESDSEHAGDSEHSSGQSDEASE
ncbi:hypothetical protein TRVL_03222 [Trypanosoma vivax]|nr:hypothetical protein TRVL_03222 [Trypanosoma vivax]